MHDSCMPKTASMAERIAELIGNDSTRDVSRKVQLHGGRASHTAVQKWLNGGEIDESNLEALCHAYGSTPAWVRYGVRENPPLTDAQQAAADLVANHPPEFIQKGFDFMLYQLERSPLTDNGPDGAARYFKLLSRLVGHKKS